jgi:predicted HAD superfamily Cof-like phosphohydrolase
MDVVIGDTPGLRDTELRRNLIVEEAAEAAEALREGDLVHVVHELCDVLYVSYGAAVTFGITLVPSTADVVHRAVPGVHNAEWLASMIERDAAATIKAIEGDDIGRTTACLNGLVSSVYLTAAHCGVEIGPCFDEMHKSQMTRIGGEVRADGKRLKPATYRFPDFAPILKAQGLRD